jgi:hypothetical protein
MICKHPWGMGDGPNGLVVDRIQYHTACVAQPMDEHLLQLDKIVNNRSSLGSSLPAWPQ